MDTFMNSENGKTFDPDRLIFHLLVNHLMVNRLPYEILAFAMHGKR